MNLRNYTYFEEDDKYLIMDTLTRRERKVVFFLKKGFTSKEIAKELNIAPCTVDTHVKSILRKTNTKRRLQAISIAAIPALYLRGPTSNSSEI